MQNRVHMKISWLSFKFIQHKTSRKLYMLLLLQFSATMGSFHVGGGSKLMEEVGVDSSGNFVLVALSFRGVCQAQTRKTRTGFGAIICWSFSVTTKVHGTLTEERAWPREDGDRTFLS